MKTNKVFALLAMTLIALSAAGYAFAHWSDSITIEAEVYTGSLEIVLTDKWQEIWVWVDGTTWVEQDELWDYRGGLYEAKMGVMTCSDVWVGPEVVEICDYAPESCDEFDPMYKEVKFTLYNAYPETAFETYTHIHNVGSIPAHWIGAEVSVYYWDDLNDDGVADENEWVLITDPTYFDDIGIDVWVVAEDHNGDPIQGIGYDPQTGLVTLTPEYQFHPCEGIDVWITFYFTDELPECAAFKGTIVFDFVQWNWDNVYSQPPLTT